MSDIDDSVWRWSSWLNQPNPSSTRVWPSLLILCPWKTILKPPFKIPNNNINHVLLYIYIHIIIHIIIHVTYTYYNSHKKKLYCKYLWFHPILSVVSPSPRLKQVSESLSKASISPWLREPRHVERTARPGLDAETAGCECWWWLRPLIISHESSYEALIKWTIDNLRSNDVLTYQVIICYCQWFIMNDNNLVIMTTHLEHYS